MKKLSLILIVLVTSMTVYSQTEKGKLFVSGGTGLQFSTGTVKYVYQGEEDDKYNQSTFTLIPSFGYFIINNLALGLTSNITSTTQKVEGGDKSTTTTILFVPSMFYFFKATEKLKPFVQIGAGLSSLSYKEAWDNDEDKSSAGGLALNIGGGLAYFFSKNVCINIGLSYTHSNLKDSDDSDSISKSGMIGNNIGFTVFF